MMKKVHIKRMHCNELFSIEYQCTSCSFNFFFFDLDGKREKPKFCPGCGLLVRRPGPWLSEDEINTMRSDRMVRK